MCLQALGLKVPYGIWNAERERENATADGLKVPYGIWNHIQALYLGQDLCLKVPYGIWNKWLWIDRQMLVRFESSLWDLKPERKIFFNVEELGLKVPYGIWNKTTLSFCITYV